MAKNNLEPKTEKKEGFEAYSVIQKRLLDRSKDLKLNLDKLNDDRKAIFGENIAKLIKTESILTENNCIPRDIVSIGNKLILGYNVHMGLKSTVDIKDVFSIYEYRDESFHKVEGDNLLVDSKFQNEFKDLYKYYKDSFFSKFFEKDGYLYMVFQSGKDFNNIKTFKWFINNDKLDYLGNRSSHEVVYSKQHEVNWKKTGREDQVNGIFPHVSIEDRLFVETIGGDLTLKIEDNTSSGEGIYSEPVENKDQKLDDGDISYAIAGNLILLKIKPYQELKYRYLVFNEKTGEVFRIDSIEKAVILLPENHGILLPDGVVKQSGGYTKFDLNIEDTVYQEKNISINGEDYEYIFYNHSLGEYYIYTYNIINQELNTPLIASGYAHFNNGHLAVFKAELEPKRNHTLQIWETSFTQFEKTINKDLEGTFLYNLGNKTIVSAIADINSLLKLVGKDDSYYGLYIDIFNDAESIINKYFWLNKEEAYKLQTELNAIKESAAIAIKEFEKVNKIKEQTKKQSKQVEEKLKGILKTVKYASFENISDYVSYLSKFRSIRGELSGLKDLQFINIDKVESMLEELRSSNEKLSEDCVEYLLLDESLKTYIERVEECKNNLETVKKAIDGKELENKIISISEELELLINIVNNLKIADTTKSSEIIDKISELFAHLNQTKSKLTNIVNNLDSKERKAEFYSKLNLITNSVSNYLNLTDTIEKVDSYLTKIVVQLDELESKFSDFEEFIPELTEKREEIVSAFTAKKQQLLEKKNKKINSLGDAADRVFKGIENRIKTLENLSDINEIFSSDLMVEKVRDIIDELISLGDATKASELESKLKTLKENSIRQLKDKKELFLDGNTIKFGKNNFLVTDDKAELTILKKEDRYFYHISGTDFWEEIDSDELYSYKRVWDQELVSENSNVYRAEYLAYKIYSLYKSTNKIDALYNLSDESLNGIIKKYIEENYNEYYTKGVHDIDAYKILKAIIKSESQLDLAIYRPEVRAIGQIFWNYALEEKEKTEINTRLKSLNLIAKYTKRNATEGMEPVLRASLEEFYRKNLWLYEVDIDKCAEYLARELSANENFVISKEASELYIEFNNYLTGRNAKGDFSLSVERLKDDLQGKLILINEWIESFAEELSIESVEYLKELQVICLFDSINIGRQVRVEGRLKVEDLLGVHSIIHKGNYEINLLDYFIKLESFDRYNVIEYYEFQELKSKLIQEIRKKLKFEELKASVLSSFVRNKLIDKVYLPLIGDNFAKQIGVAGSNKRTDNMGMLLMISPPGYGKTTLVEYIASRLNMFLVKINCPTIGHEITSLDPAQAGNANAKEELEKLNLAFEMGNNVIIYLDDIQHSNPEFLQKFISLCDGQRKIEGIWKGRSKTYQFRGKKVAVVMAGNPYTESGDKFQIPDMLSNRADVYNLGDMLRENEGAFKLSYLENAMTSNPYLNKLYMKSQEDTYRLIEAIENSNRDELELTDNYTEADLDDYWSLLKNMLRVRDEVLRVNMEYISSAAQNDKYRTEPPFKLQGSYRNMNKIAERIVPVMNDEEINNLIIKSYENDAQTLASEAEASLLKFREITSRLDIQSEKRWNEIKSMFKEEKLSKSGDRAVQIVEELSNIGENLKLLGELFIKKNQ